MDVKFLRESTIPPSTLGQMISKVASRGSEMLFWTQALPNLDNQLDLNCDFHDGTGFLIVGGRSSICSTLLKISQKFPGSKFHNSKGAGHNPLVVDHFREERLIGKSRTIIQVRGLHPYGASGGNTLRVGLYLGTNVAYEVNVSDVAAMLMEQWGLSLKDL